MTAAQFKNLFPSATPSGWVVHPIYGRGQKLRPTTCAPFHYVRFQNDNPKMEVLAVSLNVCAAA